MIKLPSLNSKNWGTQLNSCLTSIIKEIENVQNSVTSVAFVTSNNGSGVVENSYSYYLDDGTGTDTYSKTISLEGKDTLTIAGTYFFLGEGDSKPARTKEVEKTYSINNLKDLDQNTYYNLYLTTDEADEVEFILLSGYSFNSAYILVGGFVYKDNVWHFVPKATNSYKNPYETMYATLNVLANIHEEVNLIEGGVGEEPYISIGSKNSTTGVITYHTYTMMCNGINPLNNAVNEAGFDAIVGDTFQDESFTYSYFKFSKGQLSFAKGNSTKDYIELPYDDSNEVDKNSIWGVFLTSTGELLFEQSENYHNSEDDMALRTASFSTSNSLDGFDKVLLFTYAYREGKLYSSKAVSNGISPQLLSNYKLLSNQYTELGALRFLEGGDTAGKSFYFDPQILDEITETFEEGKTPYAVEVEIRSDRSRLHTSYLEGNKRTFRFGDISHLSFDYDKDGDAATSFSIGKTFSFESGENDGDPISTLKSGGLTLTQYGDDYTATGMSSLSLNGAEFSAGAANFSGELTIKGAATLKKGLDVEGTGEFTGTVTALDYALSSDERLKNKTNKTFAALDSIKQLQIHSFNYKNNPEKPFIGVMAQELITLFPSLEQELTSVNEEGYYTLKESKLVYVIIKALQEEVAKREALERRLGFDS